MLIIVFNLPWWTVGVGITVLPIINDKKVNEILVEKAVLLVRVSTLVSVWYN